MLRRKNKLALIIASLLLLVCWWWFSWDFDDSFVAGTYVAKHSGECNVLTLHKDHSFSQTDWHGDRAATKANGSWRRFGEAGIALSRDFLGATPDAVARDNVYGMLDNTFGYHTLTVDPQAFSIKFSKRFLPLETCTW